MTTITERVFDSLAALAAFPRHALAPDARACAAVLEPFSDQAAAALERFASDMAHHELPALQEHYSAVFDFDPACALELGWHLFGNTFERGAFLVELRDDLTRAGVPEVEGLPDHLVHVLALLAREDVASAETHAALLGPPITLVRSGLEQRHSPYAHLFKAIEAAIDALRAGRFQEAPTS